MRACGVGASMNAGCCVIPAYAKCFDINTHVCAMMQADSVHKSPGLADFSVCLVIDPCRVRLRKL